MASPDFEDTDFDVSERAAWSLFAEELAVPLAALKRDEFIEVARTDLFSGYHVLLIFTLTGSGRLRCTIDGMAFVGSDAPAWAPGPLPRHLVLPGLGWRRLRSEVWIHEVGKRSAGNLINAALRALWQVLRVEAPSVLTLRYPFGAHAEEPPSLVELPEEFPITPPPVEEINRPTSTLPSSMPDGAKRLLEAAGAVMSARFGDRVQLQQNVIGFSTDVGLHSNILVSPQALRLEFCTALSHQIPDMDILGAVIAEHSSRWPDISIVVTKGHVFAVRAMDAAVFHSVNLIAAVAAWEEFCSDGAIDIIEQLQPDPLDDFECSLFEQVPERLIDMVDRYSRGDRSGLTPDEIARGCRGNTPMLRRYARICAEQINQMRTLEQVRNVAGGSPVDNEGCRRQRQAIELFMPVLIAAITLAAQYNGEREMGRWN